jgi:hypothetical protein
MTLNAFEIRFEDGKKTTELYGFTSLINHHIESNAFLQNTRFRDCTMVTTTKAVKAGEEILIDYTPHKTDDLRKKALKNWGITE